MLMGGQVLGQLCSFARNVVVARLLAPEDYGIAATLAIAVSMFEMISNLAVDRLLVQAEDGDDPAFQATAHAFQVVRGLGIAVFVFALAWPLSILFEIPQALWAFQCVSMVPLIRGFMHLDPKRLQREYGFGADIATEFIPQVVLLLAAWPFVWWFKNYAAMLWLLVFQSIAMVVVSHVFAKRGYSWAWSRRFLNRMYAFGWPLLLNGLLMFFIFQGDTLIIGSSYDMATLGVYSAAFSITFIPPTMITKVASALLLPLLAKKQKDLHQFAEYYALSICVLCLMGVGVSISFILIGQHVVELIFGEKYSGVESYIGWLATMQMVRVLRVGPTIASMALGDTFTPLLSNIGRISVFPIAVWLGLTGKPLAGIVVAGCMGEIIALLFIVLRLASSQALAVEHTLRPALIGGSAIAIAFAASLNEAHTYPWIFSLSSILTIGLGTLFAMLYRSPIFRTAFFSLPRRSQPYISKECESRRVEE